MEGHHPLHEHQLKTAEEAGKQPLPGIILEASRRSYPPPECDYLDRQLQILAGDATSTTSGAATNEREPRGVAHSLREAVEFEAAGEYRVAA